MIDSVYISGPITGMKNMNLEAFIVAKSKLRREGFYSITNPFSVTAGIPGNSKHSTYMRACLKELVVCEAIYMLHGWWHSRGAIVELIVAKACGLKIMWEK